MNKYELTDETLEIPGGRTLHRIRATRAIPRHGVQKGDLGGWVESEINLSQNGDAWVSSNARVSGHSRVSGDSLVFDNSQVYGNTKIYGSARVSGNSLVLGNSQVYGNARVSGNTRINGDAGVADNALIYNDTKILTATIYTTQRLHATACYQIDGSWRVRVGCWYGSIPELRALAESDNWVETPPEDVEEARPELLAFVALCEARAAR